MALIAEDVSVSIAGKQVLHDVSTHCEVGEIVALCGSNGAGKSTLLNVMAGQLAYDHGQVSINGLRMEKYTTKKLALTRAVMPQAIHFEYPFRVKDVIEMGLLFTFSDVEKRQIIGHVSELLSLDKLLNRPYTACSGGEKQRVQLARVIAQLLQKASQEDKYLMLDESTSAMDLAMMNHTFQALKTLRDYRIGIIAVIHDLNLASYYADRIVLMSNKTITHTGRPEAIVTEQNIHRVFNAQVSILAHPENNRPVIAY